MNFRELTNHLPVERLFDGRIDIVRICVESEVSPFYFLHAILNRDKSL